MEACATRSAILGLLATVALAVPASPAGANSPPTCPGAGGAFDVVTGETLHFAAGGCSDPDGDTLTWVVDTWPSSGSLSGNTSTGEATYTPFIGATSDSFSYHVTDGALSSPTYTNEITVLPPPGGNRPPACPEVRVFVPPAGSVDLSANCIDPDGDPITYGLGDPPSLGSLTILGSSSVRYSTTATSGTDSFGYTASDLLNPPVAFTADLTITGGTTFETEPEATPSVPFALAVESPAGGPVAIDRRASVEPPRDGFFLVGTEFDIEAPAATAADPLKLTFRIDGTAAPAGRIEVFRDMATNPDPIPDCSGAPGTAAPDPCVSSRTGAPPDDVVVTVLTSHASRWNFGVRAATYDFAGFFGPLKALPEVTDAKAGRSIPVTFSLGGDQGLDVLAPGYPRSEAVACGAGALVDGAEPTETPGSSALAYDAESDTYTYVWKTDRSWSGCRQLVVKLDDGTTHRADVRFR